MNKIAVVFGYSAGCFPMAKQLIISAYRSFLQSKKGYEIHFFAYQLNWVYKTFSMQSYNPQIKLQSEIPLRSNIYDIDASSICMKTYLPDIEVYHHFSTTYMKEFDYVLFCHDDIVFSDCNLFDECIDIVNSIEFDVIAETNMECSAMISARFYPGFIFVNAEKFLTYNLSFINDHPVFDAEIYSRMIQYDGGAGLLASYYWNKKTTTRPYNKIPKNWFQHLKLGEDNGVESFNLGNPGTEEFKQLMLSCEKYSDTFLWK